MADVGSRQGVKILHVVIGLSFAARLKSCPCIKLDRYVLIDYERAKHVQTLHPHHSEDQEHEQDYSMTEEYAATRRRLRQCVAHFIHSNLMPRVRNLRPDLSSTTHKQRCPRTS